MPDQDGDWVRAYSLQALSDLEVRELLADNGVAKCHRLHYLQMAAEKVCKAYLIGANGRENVKNSHAYVQYTLPKLAQYFYGLESTSVAPIWLINGIKSFARQIELIAPACKDGGARPDNSEYPWLDGRETVQIPCQYPFPDFDDGDRIVVKIIQLLRSAANQYVG
jgi:hypothetical protein